MKERIIQAAENEIKKRGLKFSIRDIAKQLGISTKTLYQYVESKEQIIGYIVERSISEMRYAEQELLSDSSLSLKQKLQKALAIVPGGYFFHDVQVLHELQQRYPEQWGEVDKYMNEGWVNISLLVEEGTRNGEFRKFDFDMFVQVYIGAFYRLMEQQSVNRHGISMEKGLSQIVEFLLEGIYSKDNT